MLVILGVCLSRFTYSMYAVRKNETYGRPNKLQLGNLLYYISTKL
jgi:hypothetical protein